METEFAPPSPENLPSGTAEQPDEMRRRTIAELEAEITSLRQKNASLTQDLTGAIDLLTDVCRQYGITLNLKARDVEISLTTPDATSLE